MPINRRQFIKRSVTAVSVSMVMPRLFLGSADAQVINAADRKIFVVIQMGGGNDGLNTVIPYADSRYQQLRPTLGFKDTELKDAAGSSTILNSSLGLHPALSEIKQLIQPKQEQSKQWLKSVEVRKLLKISPGTLQNLRINGTLRFTRIGSLLYYKQEDINKLLEGGQQ